MRTVILILVFCLLGLVQADSYPDGDQRALKLKGTRNTRELGGLPVADGTLKKGMVYRSGALCFASREDAATLHSVGINTILELRLNREIERDGPDKSYLLEHIPSRIHWPMGNSHGLGREAYQSYGCRSLQKC